MRVSDLDLTLSPWVEDNQDGHYILSNEFQRAQFIARHGDLEIVGGKNRYTVPSFVEARAKYSQGKQSHCSRFGCH